MYFIVFHGAQIMCKIISTYYQKPPLVQSGLDPIKVTVSMNNSDANKQAVKMGRY